MSPTISSTDDLFGESITYNESALSSSIMSIASPTKDELSKKLRPGVENKLISTASGLAYVLIPSKNA